jgi:hypothetical protein
VRFTLTAGQKGDAPQAAELIEGLPAEIVMADTAYDADLLRQAIRRSYSVSEGVAYEGLGGGSRSATCCGALSAARPTLRR